MLQGQRWPSRMVRAPLLQGQRWPSRMVRAPLLRWQRWPSRMVRAALLRWVGGVGVPPHGGARCVGQEVFRRPRVPLNLRTHWTHWLIDSPHLGKN